MTNRSHKSLLGRRQALGRLLGSTGVLTGMGKMFCPALAREEIVGLSAADVVINAEGRTFDSDPALAISRDGGVWIAWQSYYRGRDRIAARRIGPEGHGPVWTVSDEGSVHGSPVVAPVTDDSAWVVWPACRQHGWRLVTRGFCQDAWEPQVTLSDPARNALLPAATSLDGGGALVTWSEACGGRSRIVGCVWKHGRWQNPAPISTDDQDAFRSVFGVEHKGTVWVVWDAYRKGQYSIWARRWLPEPGQVERVSPEGENCLLPAALCSRSGVCVAWLQTQDMADRTGVISNQDTLHAAVRGREAWEMVRDGYGNTTGAHLNHGLVEKIEPQAVATGGYHGRRRQAMLVEDEDSVWLLWERKTDHQARTPDATGDLIGRRMRDHQWEDPVILHQGHVDYRVGCQAQAVQGRFLLLASELPRDNRRVYHRLIGDLRDGQPLGEEPWTGWRRTSLPKADPIPRHKIHSGGKVYQLFWGDLHCHSRLSGDTEGEPDELLAYARDKAQLDVVVFTENDHLYSCWLSEADFALGVYYAGRYTREGEFLALPGYEWTSRLPKSPDVSPADPRNWDPRYYGTATGDWAKTATGISYPNHRTVIYPPKGGPIVRYAEVGNDIRKLLSAVEKAGGLTHPHHDIWTLSGNPLEANVEVTSGWAVYIRDSTRIHEALQQGHRFGFVGNSDTHRRCPGLGGALTGIYAEALTPEAILRALRNRRVFATSGSRIILESLANGTVMGQEVAAPSGEVELECTVIATRPIAEVTLVRDGQEIEKFNGAAVDRRTFTYRDTQLPSGTHWYYWRVVQEGESPAHPGNVKVAEGPLAWSSPHWVSAR